MLIRLLSVCSVTWLFWLYFSPQLVAFVNGKLLPGQAASSASQPVQVSFASINQLAKQAAAPLKPAAASRQVRPKTTIAALEPDRLEIDLSQRKVTLFLNNDMVRSYPVAIGRSGWETPTGKFRVIDMKEQPTWINPLTDAVIQGGDPKNPLGDYWISFWTDGRNWIGFHGTPNPETVGRAVSHGCVRMHNQDIEELFYQVSPGTAVIVKR